jgi:hypothetical protein
LTKCFRERACGSYFQVYANSTAADSDGNIDFCGEQQRVYDGKDLWIGQPGPIVTDPAPDYPITLGPFDAYSRKLCTIRIENAEDRGVMTCDGVRVDCEIESGYQSCKVEGPEDYVYIRTCSIEA